MQVYVGWMTIRNAAAMYLICLAHAPGYVTPRSIRTVRRFSGLRKLRVVFITANVSNQKIGRRIKMMQLCACKSKKHSWCIIWYSLLHERASTAYSGIRLSYWCLASSSRSRLGMYRSDKVVEVTGTRPKLFTEWLLIASDWWWQTGFGLVIGFH